QNVSLTLRVPVDEEVPKRVAIQSRFMPLPNDLRWCQALALVKPKQHLPLFQIDYRELTRVRLRKMPTFTDLLADVVLGERFDGESFALDDHRVEWRTRGAFGRRSG